jgi:hypothetical protein
LGEESGKRGDQAALKTEEYKLLQAARTLTANAVAVNTNFCTNAMKFLLDSAALAVGTTE